VVLVAALLTGVGGAVATPAPAWAATVGSTPLRTAQFNGPIFAVAYGGDKIFLGGSFTQAYSGGAWVNRQRLAAVDARTGALLDWAPAADATVRGLAVSGGSVYAVGDFGYVDGVRRDSLAQLDADSAAVGPLKHTISGSPYAVGIGHGRLFIAGRFTAIDGQPRGYAAAFTLADGALDGQWRPTFDDQIETLVVTGTRVYVGGSFHRTNDVSSTGRLVAVSPYSGALDLTFRPRPPAVVHAVAVGADGTVYAAIGGIGGKAIAYRVDGTIRWSLTSDGDVQAVAVLGDSVYLGGHFDNVCRSSRNGDQGACLDGNIPRVKLAATDLAGQLQAWAPNGNGVMGVRAMAASPALGNVSAAGEFTTIEGRTQRRFALFG
jgi:hypothetical protein